MGYTIKILLTLVLALAPVWARAEDRDEGLKKNDVFIPRQYRIRNSRSNCVWCATETVFWGGAGLESFQGLKQRALETGWHGAGMRNVLAYCRQVGVECEVEWNHDPEFLYRAVKAGCGAYVEIPGHALVVVGIDDESVRVIDNNGSREVRVWRRRSFDHAWEGHACFPKLFPRLFNRRHPTPAPDGPAPPVNPTHPVEPKPEPEPKPEVLPPPKDGKDGAPGKDADPAATAKLVVDMLKPLIDGQNQRIAVMEKKLDDVAGQIRTRFVPSLPSQLPGTIKPP